MPQVRGNPSEKWSRRSGQATQDYQTGVNQPRRDWAQAAAQAEQAWSGGVQQAIQRKSFAKGVVKAGSAKWAAKAAGKGAQRFGPGVAEAQADYEAGVAPYLQVIQSTNLPARGPKGDPRNLERVAILARALHDKKVKG